MRVLVIFLIAIFLLSTEIARAGELTELLLEMEKREQKMFYQKRQNNPVEDAIRLCAAKSWYGLTGEEVTQLILLVKRIEALGIIKTLSKIANQYGSPDRGLSVYGIGRLEQCQLYLNSLVGSPYTGSFDCLQLTGRLPLNSGEFYFFKGLFKEAAFFWGPLKVVYNFPGVFSISPIRMGEALKGNEPYFFRIEFAFNPWKHSWEVKNLQIPQFQSTKELLTQNQKSSLNMIIKNANFLWNSLKKRVDIKMTAFDFAHMLFVYPQILLNKEKSEKIIKDFSLKYLKTVPCKNLKKFKSSETFYRSITTTEYYYTPITMLLNNFTSLLKEMDTVTLSALYHLLFFARELPLPLCKQRPKLVSWFTLDSLYFLLELHKKHPKICGNPDDYQGRSGF